MSDKAPFKRCQWVAQREGYQPLFGIVMDCYEDCTGDDGWLVDIIVYDKNGERIGRKSPPMGGPTKFEPSLRATSLVAIAEPKSWPLKCDLYGDWRNSILTHRKENLGKE